MATMTISVSADFDNTSQDGELLDNYIQDCILRGYSPETIRSHKSNLRTIKNYLNSEGMHFPHLDKNHLKLLLDYLKNSRKVGIKTQKSYFSALSSFFEYLQFEELVENNPIPSFRRRYLTTYKKNTSSQQRKLISVEDMSLLINSVLGIRDKVMMAILAKTGIRRGELISIDVQDVDFEKACIKLKRKNKRSNLYVFFDDETAILLNRWMKTRESYVVDGESALIIGDHGRRIGRNMVYRIVTSHAENLGFHNSNSNRLDDHFSPHCFRHWFTTHLRRNGMSREFIKELRGDSRGEAIDIYDHIDQDELRKSYLACIPRLGIV